jgi:thymidine phosphorylase
VNFPPLIEAKHEGKTLTPEQIQDFIHEFIIGESPTSKYRVVSLLNSLRLRASAV